MLLILDMQFTVELDAERRLAEYVDAVGGILRHKLRRESFAIYAMGILGDGERKSVEPIAARACGDEKLADPFHQRLLHFVAESDWDDQGVRLHGARYALAALNRRGESVETWVVDDTGFLKQGEHSPGVQRQYTGSAGKIANCQVGVSLCVATKTEHVPLDFSLYLPESWASDRARRRKAHIPEDIVFKTKLELATDMITRALDAGVAPGVVLVDSAYGDSTKFRNDMRFLGLQYAVGVHAPTLVHQVDKQGRVRGEAISAVDLGLHLGASKFRRTTWRQGTKQPLSSRFAVLNVVPAHEDELTLADRERVQLVIEWPTAESKPTKFYFVAMDRKVSRRELVRIIKERYRTERMYQDLKGELGLDHFEGRSFRGWHHHVSVVLSCFSFVLAERARRFSPQSTRKISDHSLPVATRAPFPRFVHHRPARFRKSDRQVVAPMSALSQVQ